MSSFNKYKYVFQPIRVGNMTVKNRIQFSPMVSSLSTPTGGVSSELLGYVKMQARTGVGVITIGSTPIDHVNGVDFFGALDVTSDDNITDLRRLSEAAHRYGAKLSVELVHAGRSAPKQFRTGPAIAPTAIPVEGGASDIREMTVEDMQTIIREYCDVSERLLKANFDMVMVHAAHGNLLAQFLSPRFNHRTDYYGGSFENRCRFPLEVLRAIRERVGDRMCIDMRISGDELIPGGMQIDETIAFIKLAQEYIDTVHVSQGLIVEPRYMPYTMPALYLPHCHNVKWSAAVKADPEVKIPVTVIGGVVFGAAEKVLRHWTLAAFLIGVAASLIGLYFAQSFAMVCFWLVISGITSTGIIPGCINVYNNQVDDSDAFLATGITESGVNIGAFLTTPFIAVIESTGGTAVQSLLYTPVALVIMAFITAWCCKRAGTKQ